MSFLFRNNFHALFLFALILTGNHAQAQNQTVLKADSIFSVSVEVSGGLAASLHSKTNKMDNFSFAPALRILWEPNHLLDLGLGTAFLNIENKEQKHISNEFGTTDFRAGLTGIPIVFITRMHLWKTDLSGGIGASWVHSNLTAFGKTVKTNQWYQCYYFALEYEHSLTKKMEIGVEFFSFSMPKIDQQKIGITLKFSYDVYSW